MDEFREANLANWDERVAGHIVGYEVQRYIDDPQHLSDVVTFDLERLGDLSGKKVIFICSAISGRTPCRWPGWEPR